MDGFVCCIVDEEAEAESLKKLLMKAINFIAWLRTFYFIYSLYENILMQSSKVLGLQRCFKF